MLSLKGAVKYEMVHKKLYEPDRKLRDHERTTVSAPSALDNDYT